MALRDAPTQTGEVRDLTSLPVRKAAEAKPLPEKPPFQLWVAPDRVVWVDGECFYQPFAVPIDPGVQNVPMSGVPDTMHGYQRRMDRVMVPMDFECTAWGEKRKGYVQIEVGRDRNGKELLHHRDCWTRYRTLGGTRRAEFDADGWHDLRKRVESIIHPETGQPIGPPSEMAAELERQRLIQSAAAHQRLAPSSPIVGEAGKAIAAKLTRKPKSGKGATT